MRKWVVVDPFCLKQFSPEAGGAALQCSPAELESKANALWRTVQLKDGYAPFCKHLFIENFTNTPAQAIAITEDNKGLLQSGYEARTSSELAVLMRWFPAASVPALPPARFLDLILYSKAQIQIENEAMHTTDPQAELDYEYGIISVKPQNEDVELPMSPITMFRNALGTRYGGSGQPLDERKYQESVEYWAKHALVR